jgi:dTMP kinase
MPSRGVFITFEGTEGAGKSTLIRGVAARLNQSLGSGRVVITREPGGVPTAEKIREIILNEEMNPWTELFLYEAARAEHLSEVIEPALAKGKIVLCDRFTDSTLAYQAQARGLPWKAVRELNHWATDGLSPALTVWLDIDPAQGLARAREHNRFEKAGVKFQARVRSGYAKAMKDSPKRWLKLNAGRMSPEELIDATSAEIARRFGSKLRLRRAR